MKIEQKKIDDNNMKLIIEIEKEDYIDKYKSDLTKVSKNTSIRGFRKGKAPSSMIKKMYGEQLLFNCIQDSLEEALKEAIKGIKENIVGGPMLLKEKKEQVDLKNPKNYTFNFDVGTIPEFNIEGISEEDTYLKYNVEVDDTNIDKLIDKFKKDLGKQEEVEGNIEENDILKIEAEEVISKDDKTPKKDGWAFETSIYVESMPEELKNKVMQLSKGDDFTFDVYSIEEGTDKNFVDKFILGVKEDEEYTGGSLFLGKIRGITRFKEAEINQEFFDKLFGEGEVETVEEFREKIKGIIKKDIDKDAHKYFLEQLSKEIQEKNQFPLPEEFLKRWIMSRDDKLTEEDLEKHFPELLRHTRWNEILKKLKNEFEIEVTEEEIREYLRNDVINIAINYGLPIEMVESFVDKMMEKENEVDRSYKNILTQKILEKISERIKIDLKKISMDDFIGIMEKENEQQG